MAKRFTVTTINRQRWFRTLTPGLKCAWRFLNDECDEAGAWSVDPDSLEFHIGEAIDIEAMMRAFNADGVERIRRLSRDTFWLPGFCLEQYGKLSPDCKPHQKVIARLQELHLLDEVLKGMDKGKGKGIGKGTGDFPGTPKEEEEEKEKEEDREKETEEGKGGVGENQTPPPPTPPGVAHSFTKADLDECLNEYRATLQAFKIERDAAMDLPELYRLLAAKGAPKVLLALRGARFEPPVEGKGGKVWDPGDHFSLTRLSEKKHFDAAVNRGAKNRTEDSGSGNPELDDFDRQLDEAEARLKGRA